MKLMVSSAVSFLSGFRVWSQSSVQRLSSINQATFACVAINLASKFFSQFSWSLFTRSQFPFRFNLPVEPYAADGQSPAPQMPSAICPFLNPTSPHSVLCAGFLDFLPLIMCFVGSGSAGGPRDAARIGNLADGIVNQTAPFLKVNYKSYAT